ncbi:short-chain alcohol dehydrogenase [Fusarium torreyae]|uniref:Short-chain alcohol dehydrogenase n=1 Tax=Fusarium torreyae TaxID=1237075 RepID=A0A9W8RPI4_9HYPO|nr:short-chain alcohol dehydrogenase [Fusarium torreyae]
MDYALLVLNHYDEARPPAPTFTEKDLSDLSDKVWNVYHFYPICATDVRVKVYVITGSNTGIGKELATMLYSKNAKVYIAARNESKALAAIESIRQQHPASNGSLPFLHLELDDLSQIPKAARKLLSQETRIDVLFNNAGVMHPPPGSVTKQGYELTLGTNNLGHYLFTELITPLLVETAKIAPKDSVRVILLGSIWTYAAPKDGMDFENLDYKKKDESKFYKYQVSKAGAYYEAADYALKHEKDGIISVAVNPGNNRTDLQRYYSNFQRRIKGSLSYPPIYGAYTELFAGLSPDVTMEKTGAWIVPWGRFGIPREDLELGAHPISEGGTGIAQKWTAWLEDQAKQYR